MNEIRLTYGTRRDKKKSFKLANKYYKEGKITVEDFNDLALEGVLGPEPYNALKNIRKGLWKK